MDVWLMKTHFKLCGCGGLLSSQYHHYKCYECGIKNWYVDVVYIEDLLSQSEYHYFQQVVEILWEEYDSVIVSMDRQGFLCKGVWHNTNTLHSRLWRVPKLAHRYQLEQITWWDLWLYLKEWKTIPFQYMASILKHYGYSMDKKIKKYKYKKWGENNKEKIKTYNQEEVEKLQRLLYQIKTIIDAIDNDEVWVLGWELLEVAWRYIENKDKIMNEYDYGISRWISWYELWSMPLLYKKACD